MTIAANDTYATLATKIGRALGFQVDVKTLTVNGSTQLQIKPLNSHTQVEIQAGPVGRDALALPSSLNLGSSNAVKQAQSALQLALSTVRTIYGDMTTAPAPDSSTSGTVPKYLTNQIAQYQAALDRLTSGG